MGRMHASCGFGFGKALWLLALIAAAVWAWWTYAPDSVPAAIREQLPVPAPAPARADNPTLYKWKDAQGRWNVTDEPPQGRPYEAVKIDPDTNVLPSGVPPEQDNH